MHSVADLRYLDQNTSEPSDPPVSQCNESRTPGYTGISVHSVANLPVIRSEHVGFPGSPSISAYSVADPPGDSVRTPRIPGNWVRTPRIPGISVYSVANPPITQSEHLGSPDPPVSRLIASQILGNSVRTRRSPHPLSSQCSESRIPRFLSRNVQVSRS